MRGATLILMLFCLLASGCASRGLSGSYFGEVAGNAPALIAADAVGYLTKLYPPGRTTLRIAAAKKADNAFAAALENGLRQAGFSLLPPDGSSGAPADDCITVAYTLDVLEQNAAFYLQLRFSDGKAVSRAYTASGQPEAGRSATPWEAKSSFVERAKAKTENLIDRAASAVTE